MATIKAFTDLQQSRKLAEILPLESADMWFHPYPNDEYWYDVPNIGNADLKYNQLPCWSLAALLNVLPAECECMALEHINYGNNHKEYFMHYIGGENTENYDNPIDACYEMIIKLNELKML